MGTPARFNRYRPCKICKKKFRDRSRTNTRQVCYDPSCKEELNRLSRKRFCKKQRDRRYKTPPSKKTDPWNRIYNEAVKVDIALVSPVLEVNPADPFLSDEEREKLRRSRLKKEKSQHEVWSKKNS